MREDDYLEGLADEIAEKVAARLSDDRSLLSVDALAERLGLSPRAARALIDGPDPRIRSVKVGGARRIEPAEVDRYVASLRSD